MFVGSVNGLTLTLASPNIEIMFVSHVHIQPHATTTAHTGAPEQGFEGKSGKFPLQHMQHLSGPIASST